MDHDRTIADPRELDLPARAALGERMREQNGAWLLRLAVLAEPPPDRDFPAFLLATPPFAGLAGRIGAARSRRELSTAITDELDRFVEAYRYYLRTCHGEDVFAPSSRRAS